MNKVRKIILIIIAAILFAMPGNAFSADESVLFTTVSPDALIVLDLSGSMLWTPAGETLYIADTQTCWDNNDIAYYPTYASGRTRVCSTNPYDTARNPIWSNATCSGPYYVTSRTGFATNCSRLAIAKRAIFGILDDNNDNQIRSTGTNNDDISLNVRIGYMRFYGGNDTGGDYNSGNIRVPSGYGIGERYSKIFCDNNTSCSNPGLNPATTSDGQPIATTRANSGTPLASALIEAKSYLDAHKAGDSAKACRDKFVILISDGADTYACGGGGGENVDDMYKRRRETVARAKALADAGYKVFVIGVGADMPDCLKRTLNWAAYYGGTDNPDETNSGDVAGYNIPTGSLFPSGVTSCQTDNPVPTTRITNICGKNGGPGDTVATSNDPATANLSGYAFITSSPDELSTALRLIFSIIRSARYSFTLTSISTARITSENHLYEASFTPIDDEPFWQGHLKKYEILSNGSIGSQLWDAGAILAGKDPSSRNMKTYKSGAIIDFNTTTIQPLDLGVANTTIRDQVVHYIRGVESIGGVVYNDDNWKLGDIWHSSPLVLTTPSAYFKDVIDVNNAFATFRDANLRTSENGRRVVMAGANDGQLHVFRTSDGEETFSFIPPNMLPKLQLIVHTTHPSALPHQFFVDGPISAADVWLGSGNGTSKSASDWRTMVVFGLGRGANDYNNSSVIIRPYLWSASSSCTPTSSTAPYGYSGVYTTGTPYYCGYYAFDFTNTLNPVYRWRINPSASDALYLGDPWSKMSMGRVKIGGNEKWVGFIGGGGYDYSCSGGQPPDPGNRTKGFFVVDLSNGNILWSYTLAKNSEMKYAVPASPVGIDTDNDGFIDRVYVGNLGGDIWRFNLCKGNSPVSCNTSNWTASRFYNASTGQIRPIYAQVSGAKDTAGNLWIYWGTGDKQCPADPNAQEHFYALKDNDGTTTYTLSDIQNLTSAGQTYDGVKNGWRIQLTGQGEKVLAESIVFGGTVYFTTFTPVHGNNPCEQGGTGRLYGVNYVTGAGALTGGSRSIQLGVGIPSAPIVSVGPEGASMYVTVSGGGGNNAKTIKPDANLQYGDNRSNILFWRDRRVQ